MNRLPLELLPAALLISVITAGAILCMSCTATWEIERYRPLMGYWRTQRDVIISIHQTPDHGIAAIIKSSPGFLGEEMNPGTAIITNIQPLSGGGFAGDFKMPGRQKPVRVTLALSTPVELMIVTGDGRMRGGIMKWTRVRKKSGP